MKLRQWMRIMFIGSVILMSAGCHTTKKSANNEAVNDANTAYNQTTVPEATPEAQTAAAGEESQVTEQTTTTASATTTSTVQQEAKRTYYFDFDSNKVHTDDRTAINTNAEYLVAHPSYKIMLEGHTDPRGSREYNIGLGERRAKSVAEILTTKGVDPAQIRIVSYGSEKLASAGHSEADYQLDRRVTMVYLQG